MLTPTRNGILFAFHDLAHRGKFIDVSDGGIILGKSTVHDMMEAGRWAKVIAIGPDVEDAAIKPGAEILVAPLQWTASFEHDNIEIWRTDENNVLALRE